MIEMFFYAWLFAWLINSNFPFLFLLLFFVFFAVLYECKMVGIRPVKAFGFRNPGNFCSTCNPESSKFFLWNPKFMALEFELQLKQAGILLMIGIWNPSFTARESGIQYRNSES